MAYPIVVSLGIAQQEYIGMTVGGSVVTSILTLSGYAIVQAVQSGSVGYLLWLKLLVVLPLTITSIFWGIPTLGRLFMDKVPEDSQIALIFVLASMFVASSITHILGVDAIVGAFIAGLALSQLVPLTSPLMEKLEFLGNSLFIPIFAISVGVLSNPQVLFSNPANLGIAALIVLGAVVAKFLAAGIAGRIFDYAWSPVMTVFGLTMSRSALVLVIALFGKNAGLLNEGIFNAIIVYITVTCLAGTLITSVFGKRCLASPSLS
jgi:Kef-type K+ transport system membrane component KefB